MHHAIFVISTFAALALFTAAVLQDPLPGDKSVALFVQRLHFPGMLETMESVTWIGNGPTIGILGALLVALLWLARMRMAAYAAAATVVLMYTSILLKILVDRPRPADDFLLRITHDFQGMGFPSGHAFQTTLLFGLLISILAIHLRPGWLRLTIQGTLVLFIGAVGLSRIYLGAHWPSDVLGGYLAAIPIALGIFLLHRRAHEAALANLPA